MYCSTCGSRVAEGRTTCQVCGAAASRVAVQAPFPQPPALTGQPMHLCPRCGYRGMSAGYFSRGGHVAALVGLSVLTWGVAGLGYFLFRHNHRVCPRCGMPWGPHGLRAMTLTAGSGGTAVAIGGDPAFPVGGTARRGWAILLLILAGIWLTIAVSEGVFPLLVMGLMAGGGGAALLKSEKKERERRREAILESLQLPVLQLAARKGGRLTVTDVATEMEWPMVRAEKVLNSLDDGLRVMSDITDDGVIVYDFVEIRTAHLSRGGGGGNGAAERNVLHA